MFQFTKKSKVWERLGLQDVASIKTELNPARQAVGVIGDMLTAPQKGLLNLGVGLGVDTIIRYGLLAQAG